MILLVIPYSKRKQINALFEILVLALFELCFARIYLQMSIIALDAGCHNAHKIN